MYSVMQMLTPRIVAVGFFFGAGRHARFDDPDDRVLEEQLVIFRDGLQDILVYICEIAVCASSTITATALPSTTSCFMRGFTLVDRLQCRSE